MYIPKSQIEENLYTHGEEWWYVDDGLEYVGFYYKLSTGKAYSGKNADVLPSREIFQKTGGIDETKYPEINDDSTGGINFSQIADNYDGIIPGTNNYQQPRDVNTYANLKSVDVSKTKFLPEYEQTLPTVEDYEVGYFTRYFTVQTNSLIYMEISVKTYDELIGENSDWDWVGYIPFKVTWTIIGEMDAVFLTNKNIIGIAENKIKRKGLGKYLTNKLEYFLFPEAESLQAIPNLLITATGEDYVGYYHINPTQGPMEGPFHSSTPHLRLYYKRFYNQKGAKVSSTIAEPNVIVLGDGSPVDYNSLTQQSTPNSTIYSELSADQPANNFLLPEGEDNQETSTSNYS